MKIRITRDRLKKANKQKMNFKKSNKNQQRTKL